MNYWDAPLLRCLHFAALQRARVGPEDEVCCPVGKHARMHALVVAVTMVGRALGSGTLSGLRSWAAPAKHQVASVFTAGGIREVPHLLAL